MKRRTITVEIDRVVLISPRTPSPAPWCAACARQVRMVTVDEAARLARATARTIYRLVEADRLHFTETSDGRLFICLRSLSRITSETEIQEGEF
jgi:excisionase family DNA binding protein